MSVPAIRDYLRAVGIDSAASGADDRELVRRFAAYKDEAAFELLVWRHAPLVLRVCGSVLKDTHAAEDATQATFLALARKAGTLTGRGSVVGWLYRVARRASVRLAKQRRRHPAAVAELDGVPARTISDANTDAGPLCEEVNRLPERYRVPVLLCFFEGLTHAEAARRTGLPIGTIAGRLARAKELLAKRLSRRGVALAAVVLPVAAGSFVGSTAQAATAFAAGNAASLVSPIVLSLAHGVTQPMTTLLKATAAAVVLACGATAWALAPSADPPPELPPPASATAAPPTVPVAAPVPKDGPKAADRTADARQRMVSANNLKQIMIAIHNYHDANGFLPRNIEDKNGKLLLSWRVAILPYMDHDALYKEFKLDEPWDSDTNKKLLAKMPKAFQVGIEEKGATKTYYQVFAGPGTAFEPGKKLTLVSITDGTSNTVGVVEAGPPVEWTKPTDIAYDPKKDFPKLDGPFKNVVMASRLDGSYWPLKPDLKPEVFRNLVERADGNVINDEAVTATFKPETKEEKEEAAKLKKDIFALADELAAVRAEWKKLMNEKGKASDAEVSLERLLAEQARLRDEIATFKRNIELLKEEPKKK